MKPDGTPVAFDDDEVAQGFVPHELVLPTGPARPLHTLRIELSAASAPNHLVGLHGELRR